MPTYDFRNTNTGEILELKMTVKELEQFKIDNPHMERYHTAKNLPGMGDALRMSVPGTNNSDSTFEKYVINRIKETVPGNTLKDGHKTKMSREW